MQKIIGQRYSVRCTNDHEYVSVPLDERRLQRQLAYFAEDGACRCGATEVRVFRYDVDSAGRSLNMVKVEVAA